MARWRFHEEGAVISVYDAERWNASVGVPSKVLTLTHGKRVNMIVLDEVSKSFDNGHFYAISSVISRSARGRNAGSVGFVGMRQNHDPQDDQSVDRSVEKVDGEDVATAAVQSDRAGSPFEKALNIALRYDST